MSVSTLTNWLREARRRTEVADTVTFAQVTKRSEATSLEVRVEGATLIVRKGFDAKLLREVVAALKVPS